MLIQCSDNAVLSQSFRYYQSLPCCELLSLTDFVLCMQVFSGLLIGAMLPYWFSAMTMKSVGKAALAMVEEVRRQFSTISGLMEGTARPDYRRCVEISTAVSIFCHHSCLE